MPKVTELKPVKYKGTNIRIWKKEGGDYTDYEWYWKKRGDQPLEGLVENSTKELALMYAKEKIDEYY